MSVVTTHSRKVILLDMEVLIQYGQLVIIVIANVVTITISYMKLWSRINISDAVALEKFKRIEEKIDLFKNDRDERIDNTSDEIGGINERLTEHLINHNLYVRSS